MLGMAQWGERFCCGERRVFGVRFAWAMLREGRGRDVRRARRYFARCGVEQLAAEEAICRALSLPPPSALALQAARAAEITRLYLRARGIGARECTLLVSAGRVTPALVSAANALCVRLRYLELDIPGGEGARLAACLRRGLGVAAQERPLPKRLRRGEVALLFTPGELDAGEGLALALYEPLEGLGWRVRGEVVPPPLAAALYASGALRAQDFSPVLTDVV